MVSLSHERLSMTFLVNACIDTLQVTRNYGMILLILLVVADIIGIPYFSAISMCFQYYLVSEYTAPPTRNARKAISDVCDFEPLELHYLVFRSIVNRKS